MRSIVLPWYPGGHVLSKMQDGHLYLQDWHGGGIPNEKNIKQKITKNATPSKNAARKQAQRENYKN